MCDFRLFVCAHKKFEPKIPGYEPVQAGAWNKKKLFSLSDDNGKSISSKNKSYCEMTVLYWIWNNVHCDKVGMVHYRRYFFKKEGQCSTAKIISKKELDAYLDEYDLIVPKPVNYHVSTFDIYSRDHNISDLLLSRQYIENNCPEYLSAFDNVMSSTSLRYFNMIVAHKTIFDDYMQWVFPILEYCEKKIHIEEYDSYNQRVIGFIAERLFNVWIEKNKQYKKLELPVHMVYTDFPDRYLKPVETYLRAFFRKTFF